MMGGFCNPSFCFMNLNIVLLKKKKKSAIMYTLITQINRVFLNENTEDNLYNN